MAEIPTDTEALLQQRQEAVTASIAKWQRIRDYVRNNRKATNKEVFSLCLATCGFCNYQHRNYKGQHWYDDGCTGCPLFPDLCEAPASGVLYWQIRTTTRGYNTVKELLTSGVRAKIYRMLREIKSRGNKWVNEIK